jgi:hypothetical protein
MITSGNQSTSSASAVTLLSIFRPTQGTLSVWTFTLTSGAGTLTINGGAITVPAGEFSLQVPVKGEQLVVTITRSSSTNMADWQAAYSPLG